MGAPAVDPPELARGLQAAADLLAADGAGLAVVAVHDGGRRVALRLTLDDAACAECVLPHAHLVEVIAAMAEESVGHPVAIDLDDPRPPGGS